MMRHEDFNVRYAVTAALGAIGGEEATQAMLRTFTEEKFGVPRVAGEILAGKADKRAIEPIASAMRKGNDGERRAYSVCLAKIGGPAIDVLIAMLSDRHAEVHGEAANRLGELREKKAVEPLIEMLKNDKNSYQRACAAQALGKLGDTKAIQPLKALFKTEKEEKPKFDVAFALVRIAADKEALEFMMKLSDTKNTWLRREAIKAFGEWGDERAVDALGKVMRERDHHIRGMAVEALAKIGGATAEKILIEALDDINEQVRDSAARALGEMRCAEAVEPIIFTIRELPWGIHRHAVEALSKIGDRRAVGPLIELWEKSPWEIGPLVGKALREITGADIGDDCGKWKEWWGQNKGK
jgi:HEAT repeat protein